MNSVIEQVEKASRQWIKHFNSGELEDIVNAYTDQATMHAKPMGIFVGREQIREQWQTLLKSGFSNLEYQNIKIIPQSETEAVLSADWSMNHASGVITKELWRLQADAVWRLEEDHFEVKEQTES